MIYTLRPAEEIDYDFLYQLKTACLKEYVAVTWGWDEEFQRSLFAEHFSPNEIQIIQLEDHDIGQLSLEDRGKSLFLAGIYLLPAFQGKGIGSAIITDVLSSARSRHLPVHLQVLKVNPARCYMNGLVSNLLVRMKPTTLCNIGLSIWIDNKKGGGDSLLLSLNNLPKVQF